MGLVLYVVSTYVRAVGERGLCTRTRTTSETSLQELDKNGKKAVLYCNWD